MIYLCESDKKSITIYHLCEIVYGLRINAIWTAESVQGKRWKKKCLVLC